MEYFISTSGDDCNEGTFERPFRTVQHGISQLMAGDILNLRGGNYVESVEIKGKHGSEKLPIVIRSYAEEHATIDGSVLQFRHACNADWEPASLHDPKAHKDEYVSRERFTLDSPHDRVNRGAFLDREPYTRLITYSRLEDLRANNQTFGKLPLDHPLCGVEETDDAGNATGFKRPWVYLGPGLFFKRETKENIEQDCGRIHIRLSHTSHNINGLTDYQDEVDPRKLRLAISHKDRTTLFIQNSSFVHFENLSIRYGGEYTLWMEKTNGIVFDHVRLLAASYGARLGGNNAAIFRHCEFRGGLPGWYFRSDRKAQYYFKDGNAVAQNLLGKQTCLTLFFGNPADTNIEIHHCEFLDAHDLYLFGQNLCFHHNWIHNLNDEALAIDHYETHNLHICQNVVTQCLSAISCAGSTVSGPTYIYRNLIDLRQPTAGSRPTDPDDKDVFRFGHLYKSHDVDGPLNLFQNTFLVFRQPGQTASYWHYLNTKGLHPRRSFNNIFIAVNPGSGPGQPIMLVPPPSFPGPTDGNDYHRIGNKSNSLFRFLAYCFEGDPPCLGPPCEGGTTNDRKCDGGTIPDLSTLPNSLLFKQSKSQYPPGYEARSIELDPHFRQIGADGVFRVTDDLRLDNASPAIGAGIVLPDDLVKMDPFAPTDGNPDIGCYPRDSGPLKVGVDSRRSYPIE